MSSATLTSADKLPTLKHRADYRVKILGALSLALVITVAWALETGAASISLWQLLSAESSAFERTVLLEIRSPRVVLAAFVGAALAVAGAALQGLFRNPLADPGLIGVSSGAALGAISFIVLGDNWQPIAFLTPYLLPLSAVIGAILATLFLYAFAQRFGYFSILTMLLVGIAINALANVGIGAFQYLSEETQLRTLVFWVMGSFGRGTWVTVIPATLLIAVAVGVLLRQVRQLDLLQLGEAEARHLGVDVQRLKRRIVLAAATAVGAGVALSGIIGFVGLVVPHLVRLLGGASHSYVLPAAALLGGTLAVLADLVARTMVAPAEIPVGLVTSAIGAPFFLWLITRVRPS